MDIQEAIQILEIHNLWRRGIIETYSHTPKQLGDAIDTIIEFAKKSLENGDK